jgi:citrate synthase
MFTAQPGLADVVAFSTEIAEPDRGGGSLRYRGVDIEDLAGRVSFGDVWGLLVDGGFERGLPAAEPFPLPVHSGDVRADVQAAIAMLAPRLGLRQLIDIDDRQAREDLGRTSAMMLSFVAQAARGADRPAVPQRRVEDGRTSTERFMIGWHGEPDPRHVEALDR